MTSFPTSVDPVNATLSTSALRQSSAPASSPKPVMILTTPGGNPISWMSRASSIAVTGVSSDGLRTTVLPAASAGPSFQAAILSEKFQGMIAATTPTGSRTRKFVLTPGRETASSVLGEIEEREFCVAPQRPGAQVHVLLGLPERRARIGNFKFDEPRCVCVECVGKFLQVARSVLPVTCGATALHRMRHALLRRRGGRRQLLPVRRSQAFPR